jgi:hypothetical protein
MLQKGGGGSDEMKVRQVSVKTEGGGSDKKMKVRHISVPGWVGQHGGGGAVEVHEEGAQVDEGVCGYLQDGGGIENLIAGQGKSDLQHDVNLHGVEGGGDNLHQPDLQRDGQVHHGGRAGDDLCQVRGVGAPGMILGRTGSGSKTQHSGSFILNKMTIKNNISTKKNIKELIMKYEDCAQESGGQRHDLFKFGMHGSAEMVESPSKRRKVSQYPAANMIPVKRTPAPLPPPPPAPPVCPPTLAGLSRRAKLTCPSSPRQRRCSTREHRLGMSPRRTASQLTYGGTWAERLGLSGGSERLPIIPAKPPTTGEHPPQTVMIQREQGSHHHRGGGADQPDGPAAQLFIPPHPPLDSRIEKIKIKTKLGIEEKKSEINQIKPNQETKVKEMIRKKERSIRKEDTPPKVRKRKKKEDKKIGFTFAYLHVPGPGAEPVPIGGTASRASGSVTSPALSKPATKSSSGTPGVGSNFIGKEKGGKGDFPSYTGENQNSYSLHDGEPCWDDAPYNSVRIVPPVLNKGGREDDQL